MLDRSIKTNVGFESFLQRGSLGFVLSIKMPKQGIGLFTKDIRLTQGEWGSRNLDVQLLFQCDSIVLSGRRGKGV